MSAGFKILPGHVPKLPPGLTPLGPLSETNQLRVAIGLNLSDAPGLDGFLAQLYDPTSTNYHHYITPEEFTARFSATAGDYQAVTSFALTNGLVITQMYSNRLLLDVQGPVSNINRAFHITLLNYHHPTENRDFYAPDREPSVNPELPIADASGLNNYQLPQPRI